jgi:superfamily II DNA or RNA helicase
VEDESADEPWLLSPSRHLQSPAIIGGLPTSVRIVLADEVYVDRPVLPAALVTLLVRIAAFQNPEYYRAQAMRLPTYGKPRVISCAALHPNHVALPRGCLDEALELLRSYGIEARLEDHRQSGAPVAAIFLGTLRPEQRSALDALSRYDFGVLAATTAFGKTVVAAALIAQRGCNTLILVHRKELLTQWVERLKAFLSVSKEDIGTIAGGRRKPTGRIDVALIQSLVRKGEVSDIVGDYGQLIVDECHHLSATSFELVARRSKARYVLGLSATVARKDGHHPIILMQCGPIRYKVSPKSEAARRSFDHVVRLRHTDFQPPAEMTRGGRLSMPSIYAALATDEARNTLIIDDVIAALEAGRCPLVLTERLDHLEHLHECFKGATRHLIVLRGGMGARERRAVDAALRASEGDERLLLATGRYLGEGFDDPRLDTLFLTMPISWKGTLAQYVGRLHRDYQGKNEVVYDYVDGDVPVLTRMASKRQAGYRALGYAVKPVASSLASSPGSISVQRSSRIFE